MIMKLFIGVRGSGKTKQLIELVNQAASESAGSVICVENGNKLNFDVTYKARLIDASKYGIDNADKLLGFLSGISASNHDITHLFIDSALKICKNDIEALANIMDAVEVLSKDGNFECVMTISADVAECPEAIQKYL